MLSLHKVPNQVSIFSVWFTNRSMINQKRIKIYTNACHKYKDITAYENLEVSKEHIFFVKNAKLMTCTIHKAGSTTYHGIFRSLRKKIDQEERL